LPTTSWRSWPGSDPSSLIMTWRKERVAAIGASRAHG
jgi:hypothetical protein